MFSNNNRCLFLLLPLLAWMLTGCETTDNQTLYDKPHGEFTGDDSVARLHIGDELVVTFSGPQDPVPPHQEIIKEDGTVTLPDIGQVKAAGRTIGELQKAITEAYVPKYYTRLTVTVKPGDRVFYISGDVKNPGRQIYTGPITLTKAITSAGGFTETSNPRNVVLTRAGGQRYTVNCKSILDGKKPDPDVYPGDQVEVKTKTF